VRDKSNGEKKLEKALGIKSADDLSDLNESSSADLEEAQKELEAQKAFEQKKQQTKTIKEELEKLKDLEKNEFASAMYKKLALTCMELIETTKLEMEIDPQPRYVEVMATVGTTTISALDSYRDIEIKDRQFELEGKKLLVRQKDDKKGPTHNILITGQLSDIMKQISEASQKEIKAEVVENKE
jgi:hypothetical protein